MDKYGSKGAFRGQSEAEPFKMTSIKLKINYSIKNLISAKKVNKYLNKIIILFLFFLNYYLYYLSLEKCLEGFDICGQKYIWILKKLSQAVISYFISTILFELMIINKVSKYHLVHFIIIYSYFYYYSHGLDFDDHGYFNFLGGITIVFILLLALLPFNQLVYLIKKKNKIYTSIYICFLMTIIIIYIYC